MIALLLLCLSTSTAFNNYGCGPARAQQAILEQARYVSTSASERNLGSAADLFAPAENLCPTNAVINCMGLRRFPHHLYANMRSAIPPLPAQAMFPAPRRVRAAAGEATRARAPCLPRCCLLNAPARVAVSLACPSVRGKGASPSSVSEAVLLFLVLALLLPFFSSLDSQGLPCNSVHSSACCSRLNHTSPSRSAGQLKAQVRSRTQLRAS